MVVSWAQILRQGATRHDCHGGLHQWWSFYEEPWGSVSCSPTMTWDIRRKCSLLCHFFPLLMCEMVWQDGWMHLHLTHCTLRNPLAWNPKSLNFTSLKHWWKLIKKPYCFRDLKVSGLGPKLLTFKEPWALIISYNSNLNFIIPKLWIQKPQITNLNLLKKIYL